MAREDRYRRLARAAAGQRNEGPALRDLLKVRPMHLQMTALKHGYRRVGGPVMAPNGAGPYVWWLGPYGWYLALDTSVLREPLRQMMICDQILHMSGECRICGARAERSEDGGVVCEHQEDCPVCAESILESVESSAN